MKKNELKNVSACEKKYRAKLVHGKHGWLVKGMVFGTLFFGGMQIDSTSAEAAWAPNSVEQIASRITEEQKSITMIEGDTVYNIGLAINIKDPMQLLYDNGFKDGEQYTLPVGTVISWDGNHVTVTDPQGNLVGDTIVTDDQKHNPDQPVAGQASDTPSNQNVTTPTNTGSSNGQTTKPQVPNTGNSNNSGSNGNTTNPVTPETPTLEKPVDPVNPVEPEKPVVPEQPDDRTELEKLKALLAELEAQLVVAEQELATAQQNLEAARKLANTDFDTEIANLQNVIAQKDADKATIQNDILSLESEKALNEYDLINAQSALNDALASQQQAQDAVTAAQAALDAITEVGDPEQIANAQAALDTAQNAYNDVTAQVTQAQSAVNEKQNAVSSINDQLATKQNELANTDTSAEQVRLAELQAQKENQQNQPSIAELEQVVIEKQNAVDDLKAQIGDVKQQIAAIELKIERADAINSLTTLTYLTQELIDDYVGRINTALTSDAIQAIVSEANAKNEELKAIYEAEQAAKELANTKEQAIQTITALTYLSDDEKAAYINEVNTATSVDAITSILANAQAADQEAQAAQELMNAKNAAQTTLASLNLSAESLASYTDQISEASSLDAITAILAAAQTESDANDAAQQLADAKADALQALTSLNLTNEEATDYTSQINAATSVSMVDTILAAAQATSDANDAESEAVQQLAAAKASALQTLATLNLSDSEATDYTNQISSATSLEEIATILADAQAVSNENDAQEEAAQQLVIAKDNALQTLSTLNLSTDELADYTSQINSATSVNEVSTILVAAQATSDANDAETEITEVTITKNVDEDGNELTDTAGYEEMSRSTSEPIDTVNEDGSITRTTTITIVYARIIHEVSVTQNVDEAGTVLSNTEGYEEVSRSVGEPVDTVNEDNSITRTITTTVVYRRIAVADPIIESIKSSTDQEIRDVQNQVANDDTAVSLEQAAALTDQELTRKVAEAFIQMVNEEQQAKGYSQSGMTEDTKVGNRTASRAVEVMYLFDHSRPTNDLPDGTYGLTYETGDLRMSSTAENISQSSIRVSSANGDSEALAILIAQAMFRQYIEEERAAFESGNIPASMHYNNIIARGYSDMSVGVFIVQQGNSYVVSTAVIVGNTSIAR